VRDAVRYTRQQFLSIGTKGAVVVLNIISCFYGVAGGTGSKGKVASIHPEHLMVDGSIQTMALKKAHRSWTARPCSSPSRSRT
jgi:hypothetical protein